MIRRIRSWFLSSLNEAEAASCHSVGSAESGRALFKTAVVCITAALCLTMTHYLGKSPWRGFLPSLPAQFSQITWWAITVIAFYLIVPALIVKVVLRERLRDHGIRLQFSVNELPIYGVLLAVVLVMVVGFSATDAFQAKYPFYSPRLGEPLWPLFWTWEALYVLQFAAVEFFFRGFLLHGTKCRLGFSAVFVSMVPYCLVHFGKPLPETLGAIIAGIVLGIFSLKSRSIAPGILLHCGVALGMDLAVLWRKGLLLN